MMFHQLFYFEVESLLYAFTEYLRRPEHHTGHRRKMKMKETPSPPSGAPSVAGQTDTIQL